MLFLLKHYYIMGKHLLTQIEAFLPHIAAAIIIFILGIILTKIVTKILSKGLKKSKIDPTAHSFLQSVLKTVLYVLVVIITLSALKVPMSSIIATVGAAGVAIALALQNSLSNVAGGFLLMFTHPFKCGDFIEINNVSGTVNAITILYTRLLTTDNKAVMIPNGTVSGATIINYTQEGIRRLDICFSVDYNTDYRKAEKIILDIIKANPLTLDSPEKPFVTISEHAASAIKILARVWVRSENYWDLNYRLLEQVKDRFDENGIEIPYNKLDINMQK